MNKFKICMYILLSILAAGCTNREDVQEPSLPTQRTIEDFAWLGELHNAFLDGISQETDNPDTRSETGTSINWEEVNRLQVAQANALAISSVHKNILASSIAETKSYYQTNYLYEKAFPDGTISTLANQLKKLKSRTIIDQFEYVMILNLASFTKQNMDGIISNSKLTVEVLRLCQQWNNKYGSSLTGGEYSGYILSIAKSSMEWWESDGIPQTRSASVIIGADVAGALISAGISATAQLAANKKVDAKTVAYSALGGAVTGSTGVVGKVGKILTKFFF